MNNTHFVHWILRQSNSFIDTIRTFLDYFWSLSFPPTDIVTLCSSSFLSRHTDWYLRTDMILIKKLREKETRNWRYLLFAKEVHRLLWNGIKTISKRVNIGLFSEENFFKDSSENFLWPAVARNNTSAYESSSVKNTHKKYHIQFVRIKTWLWISM